jgi:hypothetical protein
MPNIDQVEVLNPDGAPGFIPRTQLSSALNGGYKVAARVVSPKGEQGYIPKEQLADALKQGYTDASPKRSVPKVDYEDKLTQSVYEHPIRSALLGPEGVSAPAPFQTEPNAPLPLKIAAGVGGMFSPGASPVVGEIAADATKVAKGGVERLAGIPKAIDEARSTHAAASAENLSTFKQGATEAIGERTKQAAQASQKEVLQRSAEELQPRLQQHVQEVHDTVKQGLDQRWDALRATFKGSGIQANQATLAKALDKAANGVAEVNNDLFAKIVTDATPTKMGWEDIQAAYSKLGSRLAQGGLPGDVWRSLKSYQQAIGDEMEMMAKAKGVPDFPQLRKDHAAFMRDFVDTHDSIQNGASPLAHMLQKPDPATAVKPFEGEAGDRAIRTLARYKDAGARPSLAQTYRKTLEAAEAAPKGGRSVDMPKLKQTPAPDEAAIKSQKMGELKGRATKVGAGFVGAGLLEELIRRWRGGGSQAVPN